MSLFNDFLNSKVCVTCRTKAQKGSFLGMLDATDVLWVTGAKPSQLTGNVSAREGCVNFIIPREGENYISAGRLYTTAEDWAKERGFKMVEFSAIEEEISSRQIPSPLILLSRGDA